MSETGAPDHGFILPPLCLFSLYTHVQFSALQQVRAKLKRIPLRPEGTQVISADDATEYYNLFWLWTLGAYEVVRTMSEHSQCFRSPKDEQIHALKRRLNVIRTPFAKQQIAGVKRGRPTRFYGENSIHSISASGLLFCINGEEIYSEPLMDEVLDLLVGIKHEDILQRMPIRPVDGPANATGD